MIPKTILCVPVLLLFAAGLRAETEDSGAAADVAAYRAEIVAALRAQLGPRGTPVQSRLVESPTGDDRIVIGADKLRVITATIDADGVAIACHEGIENAAQAVARAQGEHRD